MRVLVVDDQQVTRDAVRDALELRGHEVVAEAVDQASAVAAATQLALDVGLVDVRLGAGSGFEVVRALQAAAPDLPVLLMSMDHVSMDEVHASGARGYVAKLDLLTVDLRSLIE